MVTEVCGVFVEIFDHIQKTLEVSHIGGIWFLIDGFHIFII